MKYFLPLLCLFLSAQLYAQHTPQEIKKFKISKILRNQASNGTTGVDHYDTRYDKHGNETATYIDGVIYTKFVYEYGKDGKPIKATEYSSEETNDPSFVYDYIYNTDGSYTVKNTHMGFTVFSYEWYDKDGRVIKTKNSSDIEELYTYDAAGKLLSIKTKPGVSADDATDLTYVYNAKGQRIKEISSAAYPGTRTYSYDARGILSKVVTVYSQDGKKVTLTDTYKYEFWK